MKIHPLFILLALVLVAACKKGPSTTPNGFSFTHHVQKNGPKPKAGDFAYFHVHIRNGENEVYNSRKDSPETPFVQVPTAEELKERPSSVLDVLTLMSVGDSITVIERIDTLPQKPQGFENATEIIYDVVLTDFKTEAAFQEEMAAAEQKKEAGRSVVRAREQEVATLTTQLVNDYKAGKLNDRLQTTGSGLKYVMLEEGTGPQAAAGQMVAVQYYGALLDGSSFDNSFQRGEALPFPLGTGRVIPGWDEGIALLKEGGKAMLFIPAALGYGEAGSPPAIPPSSELAFYVELEKAGN
mgnify:CR=1 FL=1